MKLPKFIDLANKIMVRQIIQFVLSEKHFVTQILSADKRTRIPHLKRYLEIRYHFREDGINKSEQQPPEAVILISIFSIQFCWNDTVIVLDIYNRCMI